MTELGLGVATLEHEPTGRTDADAVDATLAASGDASAFERLYRTHVPKVYGLVRRMLSDDDADEVAQDIFVRAWQKLGTFRGEAAFGTWLHRLPGHRILGRRGGFGGPVWHLAPPARGQRDPGPAGDFGAPAEAIRRQ